MIMNKKGAAKMNEDELIEEFTEEEIQKIYATLSDEEKLELEKEIALAEAEFNSITDDEAIEKLDETTGKNDKIIAKDYLSIVVEQEKDKLVYYEIENIYKGDTGKRYKNRFNLRKEPPTLTLRDNLDNEATFLLTENVTEDLVKSLKEVQRAYAGYSGPQDLNMPESLFGKISYYFRKNPIKIIFPIFVIILLVILSVI